PLEGEPFPMNGKAFSPPALRRRLIASFARRGNPRGNTVSLHRPRASLREFTALARTACLFHRQKAARFLAARRLGFGAVFSKSLLSRGVSPHKSTAENHIGGDNMARLG